MAVGRWWGWEQSFKAFSPQSRIPHSFAVNSQPSENPDFKTIPQKSQIFN